MRKLIPPFTALLAGAALSAALSYAATPRNLDRAIEVQRALVADRPADSRAANDLGSLLVLAEDVVGAEAAYRSAIALDGENASAHFNLGLLLQKEGNRRDALKEYERTMELEPRHAWAHYQIGTIYHRQGRESKARKLYAKALALDPSLGNPEVNPHLIDNELATSAMLYAYHHYREELLPAKEFEEPARIAGVLIDRPRSAERSAEVPEQEETAPAGGYVRGDGTSPGDGGDADNASGNETAEPADDTESESRVLSSKDLDPSHATNQVSGGGAPLRGSAARQSSGGRITSGNRGRTRDARPTPPRPTLRSPQSNGSMQPAQLAPPASFLPTSDSTGMIETRLVEIDEWS